MKKIIKNCLNCGEEFKTEQRYVDRGHGKFCSISCSSTHWERPELIPNCTCATCSKEFYSSQSKFKNSKSGLRFCSKKCKNDAQRAEGIPEIHPSHYKGIAYREMARRNANELICVGCGYNRSQKVLHAHHIDHNRSNNVPNNLALVCPTCHREIHVGIREEFPPFKLIGGEPECRLPHIDLARIN